MNTSKQSIIHFFLVCYGLKQSGSVSHTNAWSGHETSCPNSLTLCQSSDEISCLPVICALQIDNPNLYVKLHALVSSPSQLISCRQTIARVCWRDNCKFFYQMFKNLKWWQSSVCTMFGRHHLLIFVMDCISSIIHNSVSAVFWSQHLIDKLELPCLFLHFPLP